MPHARKAPRARRQQRVRHHIKMKAIGRPRLSVFRSGLHIYAQVIDDGKGQTLAAASTIDKTLKAGLKTGANIEAAKAVGKLLAERAMVLFGPAPFGALRTAPRCLRRLRRTSPAYIGG